MDYYSKYLKYKSKYLELKKLIGGKDVECADVDPITDCNFKSGCAGIYAKSELIYDCKQKHCKKRNRIDCKITGNCIWDKQCLPDCDRFNKKPIDDMKEKARQCNNIDECIFVNNPEHSNYNTCIIKPS